MDRLENSNQNRKASGSEGDDLDDEIFAEYKRKRLEEMSNEQSQQ